LAVGIRIKLAGVTQEMIDQANRHIDVDSNPPDGLLFHASGPIDGGWGIIDFWQSREQFDRFAEQRIGPAVGSLGGDPPQPDIREFPVHEHFPR
jgi:hypothetical protein